MNSNPLRDRIKFADYISVNYDNFRIGFKDNYGTNCVIQFTDYSYDDIHTYDIRLIRGGEEILDASVSFPQQYLKNVSVNDLLIRHFKNIINRNISKILYIDNDECLSEYSFEKVNEHLAADVAHFNNNCKVLDFYGIVKTFCIDYKLYIDGFCPFTVSVVPKNEHHYRVLIFDSDDNIIYPTENREILGNGNLILDVKRFYEGKKGEGIVIEYPKNCLRYNADEISIFEEYGIDLSIYNEE